MRVRVFGGGCVTCAAMCCAHRPDGTSGPAYLIPAACKFARAPMCAAAAHDLGRLARPKTIAHPCLVCPRSTRIACALLHHIAVHPAPCRRSDARCRPARSPLRTALISSCVRLTTADREADAAIRAASDRARQCGRPRAPRLPPVHGTADRPSLADCPETSQQFDPVLRAAGSRAGELDGHGVLGITGDHAMGTCTGCQTTFRFHHGVTDPNCATRADDPAALVPITRYADSCIALR